MIYRIISGGLNNVSFKILLQILRIRKHDQNIRCLKLFL